MILKPRPPLTRTTGLPVILIAWVLLGAMNVGCGIKGPPVPPERYRPAAVTDLSYELTGEQVALRWTLPPEGEKEKSPITSCTVYRSQFALTGTDCVDCDASFKKAGDVAVTQVAAADSLKMTLRFTETISPGFEYAYRVVCRTADGVSADESNVVRFEYRQPTTNNQPYQRPKSHASF